MVTRHPISSDSLLETFPRLVSRNLSGRFGECGVLREAIRVVDRVLVRLSLFGKVYASPLNYLLAEIPLLAPCILPS